jgi:hypothetical protein
VLHAVDERDTGPHEREQVCTVEPPPASLRHVEELVSHQKPLRTGARALRHALTQAHGRERRLDYVAGPQMFPVLDWEVEERE